MNRFNRQSFRFQITSIAVLVSTLVLLLSTLIQTTSDIVNKKETLRNQFGLHAKVISDYCAIPMIFGDSIGTQEVLWKLNNIPEAIAGRVYDKKGRLYVSYNNKLYETKTSLDESIHIEQDIILDNINYGVFVLEVSTQKLKKEINHKVSVAIFLFLFSVFFSWIIARRVQGIIAKPVEELTLAMTEFSENNDFSLRVEKKHDNEIGQLYDGFNNMLDILQQKDKEQAESRTKLQLQYDRFLAILNGIPEVMYVTDIETNEILFVNSTAKDMLKCDPVGELCHKVFHGDDLPCSFCTNDIIKKQAEPYVWEFLNKKFDRYYLITDQVIKWPDGRDVRFEMAIDINERKIAEEKLNKLNQELEHRVAERTQQLESANKDLEAFAYSISHDLRAPLRAIDGFSRIMKENIGANSDLVESSYEKIITSVKKMSIMINSLLNFSRLGRKPIQKVTINTRKIIDNCIQHLKAETNMSNIEWVIGDLPIVEVDGQLIQMVFDNLISNAIKFSSKKEHPVIEIGFNTDTEELFVKDNGVGFKMEYAQKLFGVFQRLHNQKEFEGTGIGLANVKQIVQKHGGSIRAEAEYQVGATFFVKLPLADVT